MCGTQYSRHPVGVGGSGACAAADLILEAMSGTAFVLAANTLLRAIVHAINREP